MKDRQHAGHVICTRCNRLRSFDGPDAAAPPDQCPCTRAPDGQLPWTSEQLISCTICAGCGLAIATGHSRWRRLHCDRCTPLVKDLNEHIGQVLIPLGIHSVVNQLSAITTSQFATVLTSMSTAIDNLQHHVDRLVARNLKTTGLDQFDTVDFERYVAACRQIPFEERNGWAELATFVAEAALR